MYSYEGVKMKQEKPMELWEIKGFLMKAILEENFEIIIIFLPQKGESGKTEIHMSLQDINYNNIEINEGVVKLSNKRKVPFSNKISSIKCS